MTTSFRSLALAMLLTVPTVAQELNAPVDPIPAAPQDQSVPADPPPAAPQEPAVPAEPPAAPQEPAVPADPPSAAPQDPPAPVEVTPGPPADPGPPLPDPVATFDSFSDSVLGMFFDAAGSRVKPNDPNTLELGLQDFTASTKDPSPRVAMDTAAVVITAPAGYYVARVTYSQDGHGEIGRVAGAAGGSQWTVAGVSYPLKTFALNPTVTQTVDLTGQGLTRVPVSVTTALTVFETLGQATVTLRSAEITAELLPLPDGQ